MTNKILGFAVIASVPGREIPLFVLAPTFGVNTVEEASRMAREILGSEADITVAPVIDTTPDRN